MAVLGVMQHDIRTLAAIRFALSTRRDLLLEILALRHQLAVRARPNRRFRRSDRLPRIGFLAVDAQQREVLTRREGRPVPSAVANGTVTRVRQWRVTNRDRCGCHREVAVCALVCEGSVCVGGSRTGRNIGEAQPVSVFDDELAANGQLPDAPTSFRSLGEELALVLRPGARRTKAIDR